MPPGSRRGVLNSIIGTERYDQSYGFPTRLSGFDSIVSKRLLRILLANNHGRFTARVFSYDHNDEKTIQPPPHDPDSIRAWTAGITKLIYSVAIARSLGVESDLGEPPLDYGTKLFIGNQSYCSDNARAQVSDK